MNSVIRCSWCGKRRTVRQCDIDRSKGRMFCNLRCFGLSRRDGKTKAQRVAEKAAYDRQYRAKNLAMLKAKKRAYHKHTYDPVKAAIIRKANMPRHVAYCRRPEYRKWKSQYDKQHRAKKWYGPFAEAAMLTNDLNREIKERSSNAEIKYQNGTSLKVQRRRRADKAPERSRPRYRDRRDRHSPAHSE